MQMRMPLRPTKSSTIPTSLRRLYDLALASDEGGAAARVEACVSTARDLTRFYGEVLSGRLFAGAATLDTFKLIMSQEDRHQGSAWPDGVACYRKGGFLLPPPVCAMALAGAFQIGEDLIPFAFAANVERDDEDAAVAVVEAFTAGVSLALRLLAGPTSA